MIEWLEKIAGIHNSGQYGQYNAEREEYLQLKKEVQKYKKKVNSITKVFSMNKLTKKTR